MIHILYNQLAANRTGEKQAAVLKQQFGENVVYQSVTDIQDMSAYLNALTVSDRLILCGGDGTLNRFINRIEDKDYPFPIDYYPAGSGNDFVNDVKAAMTDGFVRLNGYIRNLPTVTVNGKTSKFINGIGYGIDGYCCEEGDKLHALSDKPVNYAGIAIKGLLFHFKPRNAKVTVDGVTREFKKVWLAPAMNGRFYGGGMDVAPDQDRLSADKKLSVVVLFGSGKLKTLVVFPSIFKGEHVKHTEMVQVLTGHDVTVEFDQPTALQIDGETVVGVTKYTAHKA